MKKIFESQTGLIIAIVGVLGGTIWAYDSNWQWEPLLIMVVSFIEIVGFIFSFRKNYVKNSNADHTGVSVSGPISGTTNEVVSGRREDFSKEKMDSIIEGMKTKTKVLFIDDDSKFNVVKILKDSGWRHTRSTTDVKSVDQQIIKDADILFVDINGVGKLLNLEHEGLDLALMLKQRHPDKKVVIYSANKTSNSFHPAWDICDLKLEKNALPYQFQNIVEQYSIEFYNKKK